MAMIMETDHLTKDYGQGRGNFDLSFHLEEGKTLGLVGENGAGKTTFLRLLMGFVKPTSGNASVYGHDCTKDAPLVKRFVSYIPGEINFPDLPTGKDFLLQYAHEIGANEEALSKMGNVIQALQLDITAYPRRMSKGMKQKTAIVAAFMKECPLMLMDEPTTGLDPLMRDTLLNLLLEEKKKGRSIIMSSNTIEELEKVSDYVALISKGKLVDIADCEAIKNRPFRDYKIEFLNERDYLFMRKKYEPYIIRDQEKYHQLTLRYPKEKAGELLRNLTSTPLKFLSEVPYSLQTYFDESRLKKTQNEKGE